jgi:Icc-related predicted phosphoesterase
LKLHVLCDLHVEFGGFEVPDVGADVIVLAGDVHVKDKALKWIFDQKFEVPVIYVLGNHEFYHDKFPELIDKLRREAEGTNVHVLENDSVEIEGYRFFGCTLWSDMELFGNAPVAMAAAASGMNDYRLIRSSEMDRALTPEETVAWHKHSVKKLMGFLEAGTPERSVVVTHSCPSTHSIPERFKDSRLAPAFASNLDQCIHKHQPSLWIHGHTHENYDYKIGKTRIICNPRGYAPIEMNEEFRADYAVEI